MRKGWEQVGAETFHREIKFGDLAFDLDVWKVDATRWTYSYQGKNGAQPFLPTVEKAMKACEALLGMHLRACADQCK